MSVLDLLGPHSEAEGGGGSSYCLSCLIITFTPQSSASVGRTDSSVATREFV